MKTLRRLLKAVITVSGFIFALWLIAVVYPPPGLDLSWVWTPREPEPVFFDDEEELFGPMMRRHSPKAPHHFHMIDEQIEVHVHNPEGGLSICSHCHGVYPHYDNEMTRALLNLHGSFMDCAVCHLDQDGASVSYAWVNNETLEVTNSVDGGHGKYSAKIFPISSGFMGLSSVVRPISADAEQAYLSRRPRLGQEENAKEREKLHEALNEEPLSCPACHDQDATFDFAALGFSSDRVGHLRALEVARMVEEYDVFHLPGMLDHQ